MKKPIIEEKELTNEEKESDTIKTGWEKNLIETHFCPVCGKETAKIIYAKFSDGSIDDGDFIEATKYFFHPDTLGLKIGLYDEVNDDFDDIIAFEPKELNIDENFIKDTFRKLLYKGICGEEYAPYFCSEECVKSFLIKKLKNSKV